METGLGGPSALSWTWCARFLPFASPCSFPLHRAHPEPAFLDTKASVPSGFWLGLAFQGSLLSEEKLFVNQMPIEVQVSAGWTASQSWSKSPLPSDPGLCSL